MGRRVEIRRSQFPPQQAARKDICLTSLYSCPRAKAGPKLLFLAINHGLNRGFFGLKPGQNNWSKPVDAYDAREAERAPFLFEFKHHEMTISAAVADIGHGELSIQAICNPSASGRQVLGSSGAALSDGDASEFGWLERKNGPYLQSDPAVGGVEYHGRRATTARLSTLDVEPLGYAPTGPFIR